MFASEVKCQLRRNALADRRFKFAKLAEHSEFANGNPPESP
jgi:hypothetical protein